MYRYSKVVKPHFCCQHFNKNLFINSIVLSIHWFYSTSKSSKNEVQILKNTFSTSIPSERFWLVLSLLRVIAEQVWEGLGNFYRNISFSVWNDNTQKHSINPHLSIQTIQPYMISFPLLSKLISIYIT